MFFAFLLLAEWGIVNWSQFHDNYPGDHNFLISLPFYGTLIVIGTNLRAANCLVLTISTHLPSIAAIARVTTSLREESQISSPSTNAWAYLVALGCPNESRWISSFPTFFSALSSRLTEMSSLEMSSNPLPKVNFALHAPWPAKTRFEFQKSIPAQVFLGNHAEHDCSEYKCFFTKPSGIKFSYNRLAISMPAGKPISDTSSSFPVHPQSRLR